MAPNYFGYTITDAKIQTAGASKNVTFTDAGDLVTSAAHGYSNGDAVSFTVITTTTGISINTIYYVIGATTNTFQVASAAGGSALALSTDGTGTVKKRVETDVLFTNSIEFDNEETFLNFEGDNQTKQAYILSNITAKLSPDCLSIDAIETVFSKTAVTASLPTGLTRLTWFGDNVESAGVAAGLYVEGHAIKNSSGVETTVDFRLWVPLGTMYLSGPPSMTTKEKAGKQQYILTASKTSVDVIGAALPGIPTGGAYYAIAEK